MANANQSSLPSDDGSLLKAVKDRVRSAKYATLMAGKELVALYSNPS